MYYVHILEQFRQYDSLSNVPVYQNEDETSLFRLAELETEDEVLSVVQSSWNAVTSNMCLKGEEEEKTRDNHNEQT